MAITMKTNWFYGNEVSDYGKEHGYVDYRTLAKAFDAVMNNSIMETTAEIGYWDMVSGRVDNSEEIEELNDRIDELSARITETSTTEEDAAICEKIQELRDEVCELQAEEYDTPEIFQFFIVSAHGAEILEEADEIVFYNEELDMYVWGVTHWGTSWDYVLTNIKIEKEA